MIPLVKEAETFFYAPVPFFFTFFYAPVHFFSKYTLIGLINIFAFKKLQQRVTTL